MSPDGERHQHKAVSPPPNHPTLLLPQPGYDARNWCVDGSSKTPQLILQGANKRSPQVDIQQMLQVETLQSDGIRTHRRRIKRTNAGSKHKTFDDN